MIFPLKFELPNDRSESPPAFVLHIYSVLTSLLNSLYYDLDAEWVKIHVFL